MNKADFLIELWVEDMPVSAQLEAEVKIKEAVENLFISEKIDYGQSKTFSTPRRVAVFFENVSRLTREEKLSIKGPPAKICFDGADNPTVVLEGFLKKHNADPADVRVRDEGRGEFVFFEKTIPRLSSEDVIRHKIAPAIEGIKFTKVMRWDNYSFPRPVRNVLIMFGKKTLKVRCFGVNSSHSSRGFMGEAVAITSPAGYETDLKRKRILASRTKRFEHLTKELNEALKRPSAPSSDNYAGELKNFTVGICEYPRAMAGEFDKAFLMLPPEFLKVTLEFHQGCFSVNNGKLRTNKFIFVVDGTSANAAEITKNYERCVTARFKDTKFFWENDKKKKLIEYYDKLKNVNYMGKFATLYDKAERITRDASELAKIYRPAEEGEVRKTAKLLYCDIVTQIVGEFPELHGIAGQYLERSDAGSISCADSLRGAVTLDALNDISSVVGLAERLNTLKSFFYADMIPTTSKDPYGLIKSADGAVKILLTSGIDFGMKKVFEIVFDDIESGISEKIYDFLKERYKLCLVKEGIPADIANMTESKFEFPKDALALSWAVEATRKKKKEEFAYIAEAAKRIRNILRQAKKLGIKPMGVRKDLFIESEEKNLFDIAVSLRGEIELMVVKKDYISALMSLVTVKEPLDLFFEKIMVMDKDESLRDNRLGLLRDVDNLFAIFGKFDTLNALVL